MPNLYKPIGDGAPHLVGEVLEETVLVDQLAPRVDVQPVLPAWARSRSGIAGTTAWHVRHLGHSIAFHAVRLPLYAFRIIAWSPRGVARAVIAWARWQWDAEDRSVRLAMAGEAAHEYLVARAAHADRLKVRAAITAALTVVAVVLLLLADAVDLAAAGAGLVVLAGLYGRPADRPLATRAVVAYRVERLTSDVVVRALGSIGIAALTAAASGKAGDLRFPAPITRDGAGWRADVDLPHGVTASDVAERRDRLASGLRRPLGCVWPEGDPAAHEGRLVLYVGDTAFHEARQPAWPLLRSGAVSLFRPVPFGTDQRGRSVAVALMYQSVLVGAMPRQGKTVAVRLLALAAALDPLAELHAHELKGTGDLSALEAVAASYGSGADDEALDGALAALRHVHAELDRRAKVIRGLPKRECPDSKVTPELAARKSLRLHPLVLVVDECQELFADPDRGEEAGRLATAIVKRGPALGIILILATQRPDKDSLPTGVSANVGVRFCLRVMGQVENDMVLGTSAYRNGLRATTFSSRDLGIGYLAGHGPDAQVVRTHYVDGPAAERVAERALEARGGARVGTPVATPTVPAGLLHDVLAVVPAGEARVWSETVCGRLAEHKPDVYDGWSADQLGRALASLGVETAQIGRRIEGRTVNRRGLVRADVVQASARRNGHHPVG